MKTQTRKNRSFVKGIKLTLLTILLQSTLLGFALVLKANNLLPDDFVNYSGRITLQNSATDANTANIKHSKNRVASINSTDQNDATQDDLFGETAELTTSK